MNEVDLREFVSEWFRDAATGFAGYEGGWAFEYMMIGMEDKDPVDLWERTKALVAAAASEADLSRIGAAPLERLLSHHGDTVIPWLETEVARDKKMVIALRSVWRSDIQPEVWSRVLALLKNHLDTR